MQQAPVKSVKVIGAGGNIGSHAVAHIARILGVGQVTLVDRDVYEWKNLRSQDITRADVGKPKALVQARRLRRIRPDLRVVPVADDVRNVPLGQLRADVILACLDSRAARQCVNEVAWRLGVPWIDAGVAARGWLARVNVYVPSADAPCLECAWDARDYKTLEQTQPCQRDGREATAPTNAPSGLGALAAALQAIECQKLLSGQWEQVAVGRQVLIDAAFHTHCVTTFRRNPQCRFDHAVWHIEKFAGGEDVTLGQVLQRASSSTDLNGSLVLKVEGNSFVTRLTCPRCYQTREVLCLSSRLASRLRMCPCGQAMLATGFDRREQLGGVSLSSAMLQRSLRRIGLRTGDVLTVRDDSTEVHYELCAAEESADEG